MLHSPAPADASPLQLLPSPDPPQRQPAHADLRWVKAEEYLNSSALAANSRKAYQRDLSRFLDWLCLPWTEIKGRHLAAYKQYLMEEVRTRQGKPLSKSSVNRAIASVKSFLAWMVATYPDLLPIDPAIGIRFEKIAMPAAQNLTPQQIDRVWAVVPQLGTTRLRDTALIHLLSHGLRAGEALSLNLAAAADGILFLADTKNNEPRLVPLLPESEAAIAEYLQSRADSGEDLTPDSPMLLSQHRGYQGQRLSYSGLADIIDRIGALADLPDLHPHQFRHTYATELLLKGVDPAHAKRLTGHKTDLSFKRYTLAGEQQAAIHAFYRAFAPKNGDQGSA